MNQNQSHIEEQLLLQYLLGNAGANDIARIEEWLRESEDHRRQLNRLEALWLETGRITPPPLVVDTEAAWLKLENRILDHENKQRSNISARDQRFTIQGRSLLRIAAVAVILAGLVALFWFISRPPKTIELVSQENMINRTLPDGSDITLNANSNISFPEKFNKHVRKVSLSGEAFFRVTPDPGKPFIVQAGDGWIQVTGTSFNVKAYPGEAITVTLETGAVEVFSVHPVSKDTASVSLVPGTQCIISPGSYRPELVLEPEPGNLFWITQRLEFRQTPLREVFKVLNECYGIRVQTSHESILDCRLTASFDHETPRSIMTVIAESFNLRLQSKGTIYALTGNGCDHANDE